MKAIYILVSVFFLVGCGASKKVVESETSNTQTEKSNTVRVDTIFKDRIKTITEPINLNIDLPCDSASFRQSFTNEKIQYKIIKEKGRVRVIFKKDSTSYIYQNQYRSVLKQKDSLKKIVNKLVIKKTVQKQSFVQALLSNIWMVLFSIILILWILNITPIFIIKKMVKYA